MNNNLPKFNKNKNSSTVSIGKESMVSSKKSKKWFLKFFLNL